MTASTVVSRFVVSAMLIALVVGCMRIGYDPMRDEQGEGGHMGAIGGQTAQLDTSVGSGQSNGGNTAGSSNDTSSAVQSGGINGTSIGDGGTANGASGATGAQPGGQTGGSLAGTWPSAGGSTSTIGSTGYGGSSTVGTGGVNNASAGTGADAGGSLSTTASKSSGATTISGSGGVSSSSGGAGGGGISTVGTGGVNNASAGTGADAGGSLSTTASTSSGGTTISGSGGVSSSSGGAGGSGACSWSSGPPVFGTPQSLGTPNTTAPEIDPVVSLDGLNLYFVSYRDNARGNDIYMSTRAQTTATFEAGVLLTDASSTSNDTHLFVGPTNLEAFVSSNRPGTVGGMDIFSATRSSTTAAWGTFSSVANINTANGEYDPHLESDQLTLWFDPVGRTDGLGEQDLFFAVRANPTAPFGEPIPATSLNSPANEWNVSLSDDGLVIVFQSDRDSVSHVYYATRSNRNSAFGAPSILAALDPYGSTLSDPFIAPDGCSIYFAVTIVGGAGAQDLYRIEAVQ